MTKAAWRPPHYESIKSLQDVTPRPETNTSDRLFFAERMELILREPGAFKMMLEALCNHANNERNMADASWDGVASRLIQAKACARILP